MNRLLTLYGTFAGDFNLDGSCSDPEKHWWHTTSHWWQFMQSLGYVPFSTREFVWSGSPDGITRLYPWNWFRPLPVKHREWFAAAVALRQFINGVTPFIIVAHSHAGQLALYAAAQGLQIPVLITIATPNRVGDMTEVTKLARPKIGRWIHVYDRKFDRTGWLGSIGDRKLDFRRNQKLADVNLALDGISHSELLSSKPEMLAIWERVIWRTVVTPGQLDIVITPESMGT